jgi:hypothetical protein
VKQSQKLELRASQTRQRLNEAAGLEGDDLTGEVSAEADGGSAPVAPTE